jgi:hypothetical protein
MDPARPLACNIKAISAARLPRYRDLVKRLRSAMANRSDLADGHVYTLDPEKITAPEVNEWITLERLCCPFLTFEHGVCQLAMRGRKARRRSCGKSSRIDRSKPAIPAGYQNVIGEFRDGSDRIAIRFVANPEIGQPCHNGYSMRLLPSARFFLCGVAGRHAQDGCGRRAHGGGALGRMSISPGGQEAVLKTGRRWQLRRCAGQRLHLLMPR